MGGPQFRVKLTAMVELVEAIAASFAPRRRGREQTEARLDDPRGVTHWPREHLIDQHISRFNADADDPSQQPNLGTPGAANHRPWLSSSYLDFGVEVDHAVRRQNKSGRELLALHQVAAPEPEPL